jgi:hypothetical protein
VLDWTHISDHTYQDSKGEERPVCKQWFSDKGEIFFSEIMVSIVIAVINEFLLIVIFKIVKWIGSHTETTESIRMMTFMFAVIFFNTVFIGLF